MWPRPITHFTGNTYADVLGFLHPYGLLATCQIQIAFKRNQLMNVQPGDYIYLTIEVIIKTPVILLEYKTSTLEIVLGYSHWIAATLYRNWSGSVENCARKWTKDGEHYADFVPPPPPSLSLSIYIYGCYETLWWSNAIRYLNFLVHDVAWSEYAKTQRRSETGHRDSEFSPRHCRHYKYCATKSRNHSGQFTFEHGLKRHDRDCLHWGKN